MENATSVWIHANVGGSFSWLAPPVKRPMTDEAPKSAAVRNGAIAVNFILCTVYISVENCWFAVFV